MPASLVPLLLWVVGAIVVFVVAFKAIGIRVIPSDRIGIVEKWWSTKGSLDKAIIAMSGEAGYQPGLLRGGIHLRSPFIYRVTVMPLVTIPQGQIGYVFARDGKDKPNGQTLGSVVAGGFQSVKEFLDGGGQKGPQRGILREGTFAVNLAQFAVITESGIYYKKMGSAAEDQAIQSMKQHLDSVDGFHPVVIGGDTCGIVTVQDGPTLQPGEIIAPQVGDTVSGKETHNGFQDPEAFLDAGGYRGRQYQVLTEGTYFINRLFATVELIDKTVVPVGFAGVVVSFFGEKGEDLSGAEYRHGELVANGNKGVWAEPLMPGKYAFNTYAGKVILVPTTNIILKWIKGETGEHGFDANLAEVGLITKDAFEPLLPLSVVIHIDYMKAPLVIQRFGDIEKLVNQTLDPMVSSYFKNQGQTKTLIELIQQRAEIQAASGVDMKERFGRYNLELEEVLIGTPHASEGDVRIETILTQLRDRQIAKEKKTTFADQEMAAVAQKSLEEATAVAAMQKDLTNSEINIRVQENTGAAEAKRATQAAEVIRVTASAEADKVRIMADAESTQIAKVGIAKAIAIDEQVKAYGGPGYQVTQDIMTKVATAIENGGMDIVPKTVVNMGGAEGEGGAAGSNAFGLLMTLLATDKLGDAASLGEKAPDSDMVKSFRESVKVSMDADSKAAAKTASDKAKAAAPEAKPAKDAKPAKPEAAAAEPKE